MRWSSASALEPVGGGRPARATRRHVVNASLLAWLTLLAACEPTEQELGSATEHFLAAQDARDKGDKETALRELDASIQAGPDAWAYYQRARLLADKGDIDKALADCEAGLKLDSGHAQLKWLQGELKKPADRRFQGRNKEPPVAK